MMRRLFIPLAALVLFATSALAAGPKDPVEFVKSLYASPDFWFTTAQDQGLRQRYLSPALAKLVTDNKKLPAENQLSYDALADGQDSDITNLKVTLVSNAGNKATVRAEFKNFDTPEQLNISLVNVGGDWRLDDIQYDQDRSLADDLQFLNSN